MRTLILSLSVSLLLVAPASAKKHKQAHARAHKQAQRGPQRLDPVLHPVSPSAVKAHEEYDSGEAQLAELRSSRDIPVASLSNQASDDEVPGQRRK